MKLTSSWKVLALLLVAGCGVDPSSLPPPETIVASGKAVQPGGQPITGGRIRFFPVEGAAGAEAYAEIKTDGSFTLQSFGGKDGVMPGTYKVALVGKALTGISPKFSTPESSTIIIDVKKDKTDLGVIKFQ